jgi:hypothetical protein
MYLDQIQVLKRTVRGGSAWDPGENGAMLDAGGDEGPSPPGRGKNGQLASDSGGG